MYTQPLISKEEYKLIDTTKKNKLSLRTIKKIVNKHKKHIYDLNKKMESLKNELH